MPPPDRLRKCSRDDCPPHNINVKSTVKCFNCDGTFHLPCYDIIQSSDRIFVSKNVIFVCDECLLLGPNSPKRKSFQPKLSASSAGKLSIDRSQLASSQLKSDATKDTITSLVMKIDQQHATLIKLEKSVESMHSTITDQKTVMDATIEKNIVALREYKKVISYASVVGHNNQPEISTTSAQNATTSSSTGVQKSQIIDAANKLAFKNRKLSSGTKNISEHGLGGAVQIKRASTVKPKRVFLPKSIYLSRLQTSVKPDDIVRFMKKNVQGLDESHISLRLLVKKDQSLDDYTFISYRLSCTIELFDVLMSSDFWPKHVMIGEFIEKPAEKRSQLGDFVTEKINALTGKTNNDSTNDATDTELSSQMPKNDLSNSSTPAEVHVNDSVNEQMNLSKTASDPSQVTQN